jgi:hypothetical protein
MKRCFLISPIGAEGSEIREHADDVLDFIIKPAMEELGYESYRSDHSHAVGKISDQMFKSILHDDLCVALLTFQNPNVYYELAVAQSAARPVIILALKGMNLPFDIKDMRVVYYDLKPRPLSQGVYKNEIIEKVRFLENEGINRVVPFAPELSPLSYTNQFGALVRAEDFGPSEKWMDMLRQTTGKFDLLGISLGRWTKLVGIKELFSRKALEGCKIRILLMDQDNPSLNAMLNQKDHKGSVERTKEAIGEATEFFNSINLNQQLIEVRYIQSACPHQTILINDDRTIVIPYLYSNATFLSPLFDFPRSNEMYDLFMSEFESLWEEAGLLN